MGYGQAGPTGRRAGRRYFRHEHCRHFAGGTLTLSGLDSVAHYQQVLRTLSYDNTAGGPQVSSESLDVVATDDASLASNMAVTTINTAGPVITVEDHTLLPDTAHQEVDILVSSPGAATAVQGVDLNAQIGDGGAPAGGTSAGPTITADLVGAGTLFAGNNTGDRDAGSLPLGYFHNTTTADGTVTIPTTDVLLVRLFIDTTGFDAASPGDLGPGHWSLNMFHTANGPTDFGPIPANNTDGSIVIAGPEIILDSPAAGYATTWSPAAGPVNIGNGAEATINDATGANLTQLTATLTSPQAGDVLAADVTGTSIIASFGGGVLTLSGSDTLAHYRQVLESITYDNTAGTPAVSSETINVVATDDGGLASNTAVATVYIGLRPAVIDLKQPSALWSMSTGPVNVGSAAATIDTRRHREPDSIDRHARQPPGRRRAGRRHHRHQHYGQLCRRRADARWHGHGRALPASLAHDQLQQHGRRAGRAVRDDRSRGRRRWRTKQPGHGYDRRCHPAGN